MPPLRVYDQDIIGPAAQNVLDQNTTPTEEAEEEEREKWNDIIDITGGLEFEFHRVRGFDKHWYSSFQDATAEIDFSLHVNDWVSALIATESDVDNSDLMTLKEGYFTVGGTDAYPYFIKAGYQYLPFGLGDGAILGDTLTITDPLTIEIFQIRQSAGMLGKVWGDYRLGVFAFDRTVAGFSNHSQWGLTFDKGLEADDDNTYDFGIDFLSSIFETDGLSVAFPEALATHYAPGVSLHARYFKNHISFLAEVETALQKTSFTQDDTDYHIQPAAWMVELGYITEVHSIKSYVAVDYSESYDMQGFFAKNRMLGTIGAWVLENTLLAFEIGHENDYSVAQNGTGNSGMTYIMQLAVQL
jgi:hypothetical protein